MPVGRASLSPKGVIWGICGIWVMACAGQRLAKVRYCSDHNNLQGAHQMTPFRVFTWILLFNLALPTSARQPATKDSPAITERASEIKAHMQVLADDLFEGRGPGTRGDNLTQLYLRTRMAAIGLQPAGDAGSFIQSFSVRSTRLIPDSAIFEVTGAGTVQNFRNGKDIIIYGNPLLPEQNDEAGIVFAGYGITAPEFGINDYAGLDVTGKIVVLLGGPPAFLPAAEAAHHGSLNQQRIVAERNGAIGVIMLWTPALERRFPFARYEAILNQADLNWRDKSGQPFVIAPKIRVRAIAHYKAAAALLAGGPKTLDALITEAAQKSPQGFPLSTRLRYARKSTHDDSLTTANVAGLIVGSDPKLKDEHIVVTAHHDHLGIGTAIAGDSIYNGALDNAVGTSMLLEVASTIMAMPKRPARSILFLAVGAEEKGLIGSDYFTHYPTVASGSLVANINLDGAIPFYDFSDVIAFGAEQSQLDVHLAKAAGQLGLKVMPDPFPHEGIFTRSDQYSFVKKGIPATFLYIGFTDIAGRSVGRKFWDEGKAHLPDEDLSQPIDYQVVAKFANVFRRLILVTADSAKPPLWYDDSIFGKYFAADAPKAKR